MIEKPEGLAAVPDDAVVELDVRDDLREGREPFERIMASKEEVPPGGALRLRAIFEPAPLYRVLGSQGFDHWTERLAHDDWVVWFWKPEREGGAAPVSDSGIPEERGVPADRADAGGAADDSVVVLDVRGLEPPEPMVRTLAALDTLPADATLVQINVREPRFLFPRLDERGFTYQVRRQEEDLVRVFIRHGQE